MKLVSDLRQGTHRQDVELYYPRIASVGKKHAPFRDDFEL